MSLLGTVLLMAAAAGAAFGAVFWVMAARSGDPRWAAGGRRSAYAALLAVATAIVSLEVALLRRDTSLAYVARVVEPDMAAYYRVTALWSALEGSLLLWLLCLAVVTACFVTGRRLSGPLHGAAAATLCTFVGVFAVVGLMATPFLPAQDEIGPRPSPLLQDHPAMAVHPPLLYLGFAGLMVPYALSIAALSTRRADRIWGRLVRTWTLVSWMSLTAGIVLGAWWSYAVLGWGGYWAWDPVENASLMPWLLATALLHAFAGVPARAERHGALPVALAATPFLMVLGATFLTRSGMVESIHAFSTSPLGPVLLGVLVAATLGWAVPAVLDARRAAPPDTGDAAVLSRRSFLQAGRMVLVLITALVLVGSVLPAVLLALTGDRVAVGPPWYHRTLAPFALGVLVLMAIGPLLSWKGKGGAAQANRLAIPAVVAGVVMGVTGLVMADFALALSAGIAAFVLTAMVHRAVTTRGQRVIGGLLAHAGISLGAVAVVASGHGIVTEQTVPVGGTVTVGTTSATLLDFDRRKDGPRTVAHARLVLAEDGRFLGEAEPELRWYSEHSAMLSGPDITTGLVRDVYVTLLDIDPVGRVATIRLAVNPMIGLLWAAGGIMVVGAAVSAWPRRGVRVSPVAEPAPVAAERAS